MLQFTATILRFGQQGEKTDWTYIEVPADIAQQLRPGNKKSFRVKGKLDHYTFNAIALLPMGGGNFIMPLNATIRKGIKKRNGAMLVVKMAVDDKPLPLSADLMQCLADEPKAKAFFEKLPKSHQNYFSNWIESAKTETTKSKRIAGAITAFIKQQGFGEMLREAKRNRLK